MYDNGPNSQIRVDELLANGYLFSDSKGNSYDKSKFVKTVEKTVLLAGKQLVVGRGKVLFHGNVASVTGGAVSYLCPNSLIQEYVFDNSFEKIRGEWKMVASKITFGSAGIQRSCIGFN